MDSVSFFTGEALHKMNRTNKIIKVKSTNFYGSPFAKIIRNLEQN